MDLTIQQEDPYFSGLQTERTGDEVLNPANAVKSRRPRGRPPKPVERHERELRITPPEGQPIAKERWDVAPRSEVSKLLVCMEGGVGTGKALHYHLVIESTYSDEMIKAWVRKVLDLHSLATLGNTIYRSGKVHEKTYQYVVKENNLTICIGYTGNQYTEWVHQSDLYRQELDAERRQKQRLRSQNRAKQLRTVEDTVKDLMKANTIVCTPHAIIKAILEQCREHNVEWPTRTQMDSMVNRLRWENSPEAREAVVLYYANNFSRIEYSQNAYG
jgi:hypothetical protein